MRRTLVTTVLAGSVLALGAPAMAAPTCADTLGIANHGQHIVGDYVTGIGAGELGWPPTGSVGGGGGVAVKGGPGPGFHFPNDFAPGASFCTGSNSPGTHP